MTILHSSESTTTRKFVWAAVILLAAAVAACGGSTQGVTGTAPSLVSPAAATTDGAGTFNLLKAGKGKGGHSPAPEIGTTPEPEDPEGDAGESGHGHGRGKATIQYEGFTKSISGDCPALTIVFDDDDSDEFTVKTEELTTEFQRATCEALKASTAPSIHLHVAAKKLEDDSLVAIYVRMQGPRFDHGEEAEE